VSTITIGVDLAKVLFQRVKWMAAAMGCIDWIPSAMLLPCGWRAGCRFLCANVSLQAPRKRAPDASLRIVRRPPPERCATARRRGLIRSFGPS
jgi:hypothetical protein